MRLLRSLLTSLLEMLPEVEDATKAKVTVMPASITRFDRSPHRSTDPAHECADRPWLGCPACFKATGDPFVTVNSFRQKSKTG